METLITSPHGSITLRPAQITDAQAFREIRLEALQNHPEAFGADYATNFEYPMTFYTERLNTPVSEGMIFFAASCDGLIGMCGIRRDNSPKTRHNATIWGVYVRSEWRGLHIAEGLIAHCMEWATEQRIKNIKLSVVTTNTAAIRIYMRCNFKVYGVDPQTIFYDGVMYDELLMVKEII